MYKIDLEKPKNGAYMGVVFAGGKGKTDSVYLASRFRAKGYAVEGTAHCKGGNLPPETADKKLPVKPKGEEG
jgi:tetraacyldisaccharide-1-P 4'-kinase